MALTTDDLYDMRGTPFGPSQATMDRILTFGGGNIFQGGVWAALARRTRRACHQLRDQHPSPTLGGRACHPNPGRHGCLRRRGAQRNEVHGYRTFAGHSPRPHSAPFNVKRKCHDPLPSRRASCWGAGRHSRHALLEPQPPRCARARSAQAPYDKRAGGYLAGRAPLRCRDGEQERFAGRSNGCGPWSAKLARSSG